MNRFDHRRYRPAPPVPPFERRWPGRTVTRAPQWLSEDLRDGNQALADPMGVTQKQRMWELLVKVGFRQIMAGFPSASQPDFDFVRWLIEHGRIPDDVTVAVLVQAREHLIRRTFEALEGVPRAIVHVYNSTSPVQRERVFGTDRAGVLEIARRGAGLVAEHAARHPDTEWTFQYSPESFTGTEIDFSLEVCEAVMDLWQPTPEHRCILNLPATVEVGPPNHFADQIEYFCTHLSRRGSAIVSVHTHNDRGGAAAAAELALLAGAERVEGTLLGNGERTGNMDIITLAINLYSQGIDPELDLSDPADIVRVYTECTGMPVHPRHPWVGELVYTAFSGSHQDAIRKCLQHQRDDEPWQVAYLPIDPRDIGRDYQAVIRYNSQSGKGGMSFVLERDHGIRLPRWLALELAPHVQAASERSGGELSSTAVREVLESVFAPSAPLMLTGYRFDSGGRLQATVQAGQRPLQLHGTGNGPISAFLDAWTRHCGQTVEVSEYDEHALGAGSDATAMASVRLDVGGRPVSGVALDPDTVGAALRAVVAALNRASAGDAGAVAPAVAPAVA